MSVTLTMEQSAGLGILGLQGDSGKGKTSIAHAIAARFGAPVFETSDYFRALTALVLRRNIRPDEDSWVTILAQKSLGSFGVPAGRVYMGGVDFTNQLRTPEVTASVATVSGYQGVRAAYVLEMRRLVQHRPAVVIGRHLREVWPHAQAVFEVVRYDGVTEEARAADEGAAAAADLLRRSEQDRRNAGVALGSTEDRTEILDTTGLSPEEQAVLATIMAFAAGFRLTIDRVL